MERKIHLVITLGFSSTLFFPSNFELCLQSALLDKDKAFVYSEILCREGDLPLIVAIDLQPMAPIEGVIQVQGDITNARTAEVVKFLNSLECHYA